MAFQPGNNIWEQRKRHGRGLLFKTSKQLWATACEYFVWCNNNPWVKSEAIKSGENAGKIIEVPTQRPYTLAGFAIFAGASESFWKEFRKNANLTEDFLSVIKDIEDIISNNQLEGATVGAYNANIISRKLGLADKTDHGGSIVTYNATVTKEEARDISKALENEC